MKKNEMSSAYMLQELLERVILIAMILDEKKYDLL